MAKALPLVSGAALRSIGATLYLPLLDPGTTFTAPMLLLLSGLMMRDSGSGGITSCELVGTLDITEKFGVDDAADNDDASIIFSFGGRCADNDFCPRGAKLLFGARSLLSDISELSFLSFRRVPKPRL